MWRTANRATVTACQWSCSAKLTTRPLADSEFQLWASGPYLYIWRLTEDGATVATVTRVRRPYRPALYRPARWRTTATGEPLREIPVTIIGARRRAGTCPTNRLLLDMADVMPHSLHDASAEAINAALHSGAAIPQPYVISGGAGYERASHLGGGSMSGRYRIGGNRRHGSDERQRD